MEYNENELHIGHNGNNASGLSRDIQVPSSLLPGVLQRLGLPPEQPHSELTIDDLLAKLKSGDWEVRVAAVRALGKLVTGVPVELLVSALDDEDGSVRAAAVHALGKVGKRAPLNRLVAALHDPDWHVRETAALALGKQGKRLPHEVLMTALHDRDESVREAAGLVLKWIAEESAAYGQLQEQKTIQHDRDNSNLTNSKEISTLFEATSYDARNGTFANSRNSQRVQGVQEQMQEYVPREYASYEYDSAPPSQWEKLTPRRRPQRGWWAVVAVTAFLFFLMGGAITVWVMPALIQQGQKVLPTLTPQGNTLSLEKILQDPKYNSLLQKEIAVQLKLSPEEIRAQLKASRSMTAIAAAQGFSASQLRTIELKAFQDFFNAAVKAGNIDLQFANDSMQQLQNNQQLLDNMTVQAFVPDFAKS